VGNTLQNSEGAGSLVQEGRRQEAEGRRQEGEKAYKIRLCTFFNWRVTSAKPVEEAPDAL